MAENDLNAHPIAGEADGWGERMLENNGEENVAPSLVVPSLQWL